MAEHVDADNMHTRKIAQFVSTLSYERIPQQVRERIKLLMLDSLGCAIHGAHLEWCRILRGALEKVDATRTTSVWGTPLRLSSPHAALINGTQVQGFEYDGGGLGKGGLPVDGKKVAESRIEQTSPAGKFSLDESFDVGEDTGAPVIDDYEAKMPFKFAGKLEKVEIKLDPNKLTPQQRGELEQLKRDFALAVQ